MLEEYIVAQLKQIHEDGEKLKNRLRQLCDEETEENNKISKLLENEDVGMELFSPRNIDNKIKVRVQAIKDHIDELQVEQNDVTEQLSKNAEMESKWGILLKEAKGEPKQVQQQTNTAQTDNHTVESSQYSLLLERIDKCLELIRSDRNACEKELSSIRYYLMALLSKREA